MINRFMNYIILKAFRQKYRDKCFNLLFEKKNSLYSKLLAVSVLLLESS